jgi:hypothetical protein
MNAVHHKENALTRLLQFALALVLLVVALPAYADKIDDFIREQMQKRQITGLSLAIIQDGKIVKAQGYGITGLRVTPPTRRLRLPRCFRPVPSVSPWRRWLLCALWSRGSSRLMRM